jgi:D-alanine-D-alanine ligase-like ATP-grasp enzyme
MEEKIAFIVASDSLVSWLGRFLGEGTKNSLILKKCVTTQETLKLLSNKGISEVCFISDHESLRADQLLASELRLHGFGISIQSQQAIEIGLDKLKQKIFLEQNFIPTAKYYSDITKTTCAESGLVKKYRYGTQAEGHTLDISRSGASDEEFFFFENFIDGVEYSVNVYSSSRGNFIFPVVYKGNTQRDLTPPYGRMRIVDPEFQYTQVAKEMKALSAQIAGQLCSNGFLEVEFIVDEWSRPLVLEINPRVSGTLRMSAMADNVPAFDLFSTSSLDALSAMDRMPIWAAEVPNRRNLVLPTDYSRAIATTRISMCAERKDGIRDELVALTRIGALTEPELQNYSKDLLDLQLSNGTK